MKMLLNNHKYVPYVVLTCGLVVHALLDGVFHLVLEGYGRCGDDSLSVNGVWSLFLAPQKSIGASVPVTSDL